MLYNMFNSVAPVQSCRVCRHAITRQSLGYAYVNFHTPEDAERVLDTMNYCELNGVPCRIMPSQRDPTDRRSGEGNVFIKNLPLDFQSKDLHDLFSMYGDVLSCKVPLTPDRTANRGYGFGQFSDAAHAQKAIEELNGRDVNGSVVVVTKYIRRQDRESKREWTNLYVKNVPKEFTEEQLTGLFTAFGPVTSTHFATDAEGKFRGFGFVNMENHEDAVKAMEGLNGKMMKHKIEIAESESPIEKEKALFVCRAMKKDERERHLRVTYEKKRVENIRMFQGRNVYVRNLDEDMTDEQLRETFASYGEIDRATIKRDKDRRSRNFGFVLFMKPEDAAQAVADCQQSPKMVKGKPLYVALWQPREVRQQAIQSMQTQRMMFQPSMLPNQAQQQQMMMMQQRGFPQMGGFQRGVPSAARGGKSHRGGGRGGGRGGRGGAAARPGRDYPQGGFPQQQYPMPQMMQQQQPQVQQQQQPQADLRTTLSQMSKENSRQYIGEQLFTRIHQEHADFAPKITGMLLEGVGMDELINTLENPSELQKRISEALQVLQESSTA